MKRKWNVVIKILVSVYLLMSLVFMGNLSLIVLDFKPILPVSLTSSILELVIGNFMITISISFVFGALAAWIVLDSKK